MNGIDLDAGLTTVMATVKVQSDAIMQSIRTYEPVSTREYAALVGAVSVLLDALYARMPETEERAA